MTDLPGAARNRTRAFAQFPRGRRRAAPWLLALLLCGSACSGDGAAPSDLAPGDRETRLGQAYDRIGHFTGDLDAMVERRVIRVLTVYSIGRYFLYGGEERGIVVETARQFQKFINRREKITQPAIHVAVIPVARDQLVPALLAGRGDVIIASFSVTPERRERVAFSEPASKPLSEVLVTGPSAPPLGGIEDLADETVYLRHSSSYRESVEGVNERFRAAGLAAIEVQPVSELLEDSDLVEMVNAGLLPWAIVDDYKLPWWEGVLADLEVREDIVFRDGVRTAWALREDNPQLMQAVNEYLRKHREGTMLGNVLKRRYYDDFDWAANALSPTAYERFAGLEKLFRKYGERFGIDYRLLAAQGFQESRLDQSARSPGGAVGIMQIKPSTARDPNVNVPDIGEAEGNIHAATKYLDFLRSRYFSGPEIGELDSWLLALAAYNAGPARTGDLREKARDMGYDPNVWFDNVELAAVRHVGREPVQYVANIFKYYTSYQLSQAQLEKRRAARERAGVSQDAGAKP